MAHEIVAALIIQDKQLLLVHSQKYGLRIEPPGGKLEDNETSVEATIREVKEEIGVEVKIENLFGEFETNSPEGEYPVKMFLATIISGTPKILEPEKISGYRWYSYDQLLEISKQGTLVPNMVQALPKLKKVLR